ncbi:N-acetylmuramoyl-L-alanine amidase CwlD [Clostridium sp. CM027]|uniref:N-acetylmuramoyl-L-alanine amidase CwlD n=1 Tax=Clostridium sp. CM027 TaxID=2849865 RepID=UPI001C6F10B8|nr:N-acetylmuramoyl-L-alanine amidase CwlD [Clostridium sp. CM027]MBW9145132.1 N-acetylmuramoyl-L-alanine amidase CwlD [Clostridium sp. CM027]UVE40268.1 N-acetylmuramoyl-L-alanine amidase CwlD [Clostridium sp. CM027]
MRYKNNKLVAIIIVIIVGMVGFIGVNLSFSKETMNASKGNKKILIDAGHGGMDGGTSSQNGTVEKDINLSIAKKLKESLKKAGYEVVMTREEDTGSYSKSGTIRSNYNEDLKNRCDLKKSSNCDMLISVHLNYFSQSKYYGAQVWYSDYKDSVTLASTIQKNLRVDLDPNNKRIQKPAKNAYKLLRVNDNMPSVIVECGFLSNNEEEQKLKSDEYQRKIADSISKSVDEFFKSNPKE